MVIFFLVFILLIIILLVYGRLSLGFTFTMKNLVCSAYISIYLFRKKPIKKIMIYPPAKKKEKAEKVRKKRDINEIKSSIFVLLKLLKRSLMIQQLKLHVREGTGDACYTALLYGFLWNVVSIIPVEKFTKYGVKNKQIKIEADFKEKIWELNLDCIFNLKIVNIISMCKEFLKIYLKNKKGGVDDVRSSNRRSNDYSHAKY